MARWVNKLISEYEAEHISRAVMLTNSATDTKWFQSALAVAAAICFPRYRIRFIDASGEVGANTMVGQALFYLGPCPEKFAEHFHTL